MKRKITIIIVLLLIMILFTRPATVRQLSVMQEISLADGKESSVPDIQIEKKTEAPSIVASTPASMEQHPSSSVEKLPLAVTVEVEPVLPAQTENLSEEMNVATVEEETLSIVMISTCGSEEAMEGTAPPAQDMSGVKGFHILGNSDDTQLDLVVRSSDDQGCEQIHFLDWNGQHPNEFTLHDALRGDTSVSVFADEIKVAQFSVPTGTQEEYIALNLKSQELAVAYAE